MYVHQGNERRNGPLPPLTNRFFSMLCKAVIRSSASTLLKARGACSMSASIHFMLLTAMIDVLGDDIENLHGDLLRVRWEQVFEVGPLEADAHASYPVYVLKGGFCLLLALYCDLARQLL